MSTKFETGDIVHIPEGNQGIVAGTRRQPRKFLGGFRIMTEVGVILMFPDGSVHLRWFLPECLVVDTVFEETVKKFSEYLKSPIEKLITREETITKVASLIDKGIHPEMFYLGDAGKGHLEGRLCVDPDIAFAALRLNAAKEADSDG